jgi:translation initiation factor IF-3
MSVKAREARKKQTRTVIKEVKFKPKIGEHDYLIKQRRTIEFLAEGDKVKVTIWFRGREAQRPELGLRILDRLAEEVTEYGVIEQTPSQEGRNMTMVLGPVRRRDRPKEHEEEEEETPPEMAAVPASTVETEPEPEQPPSKTAGGPPEEVAEEAEAEELAADVESDADAALIDEE